VKAINFLDEGERTSKSRNLEQILARAAKRFSGTVEFH